MTKKTPITNQLPNLRQKTLASSPQTRARAHTCLLASCEFGYELGAAVPVGVDGLGTIESPTTTTGLPFAELLVPLPEGGRPVGVPVLMLDRSELACDGGSVVVDVDVGGGGGGAAPLGLLLLFWTSWPSVSGFVSMNAMVGPATSALLPRWTALPFSGWSSDVTKIATAPLMPWGTTHWLIGSEMEKGRPPVSIWQKKPCWTVRSSTVVGAGGQVAHVSTTVDSGRGELQ